MAKETVRCILCGKEHSKDSEDILKIHHPTKPMAAAFACRTHRGIEDEHNQSYPADAFIAESNTKDRDE